MKTYFINIFYDKHHNHVDQQKWTSCHAPNVNIAIRAVLEAFDAQEWRPEKVFSVIGRGANQFPCCVQAYRIEWEVK